MSEFGTPSISGRPSHLPEPEFALGLIANETNAIELGVNVLEARMEGHPVLVTYYEQHVESVDIARRLGARIVHPETSRVDGQGLEERLIRAARRWKYPGLMLHTHTERTIDFDKSVSKLEQSTEYAVRTEVTNGRTEGSDCTTLAVVPAFNEVAQIETVVTEAAEHVDAVLVVDDGSTDGTADKAAAAGAVVISHETNRGYGAALTTGFCEAKRWNVDHLVVLDGDGQHDSGDISKLVATQRETGSDIVIGSRLKGTSDVTMPLYRRLGLGVINCLMGVGMWLLRAEFDIRDTQSGFRVYNKRAVATLAEDQTISDGMGASLDILFHAFQRGYTVSEVETSIKYEGDTNTHHPIIHGYGLVQTVYQTLEFERPLISLGIAGFSSTIIGLAFAYWTVTTFGEIGRIPVEFAATSVLFTLLGLFACFNAILVRALKQYLFMTQPS